MLGTIGAESIEGLFSDIPASLRFKGTLDLPPAMSEMEVTADVRRLAGKNADADSHVSFLGAGAYDRFIPAVVDSLFQRGEFLTAYTPYQAEASQGTLTVIFEFQSMICELMGMQVANASHYDGATALAEAAGMAADATDRKRVLISQAVNPIYREVVKTYHRFTGVEVVEIPAPDGVTKLPPLTESDAGVFLQQPNFYGCYEDLKAAADAAHAAGALAVAVADPIAASVLKSPGECGCDFAVGEAQPLGVEMSFGGPAAGFMAVSKDFIRKIPGRIAGCTTDADGKPGYVLALSTREQHIRREKASSNICTNQGLMALRAAIYVAAMGAEGLRRAALVSAERAHALRDAVLKVRGVKPLFDAPFLHEFTVTLPKPPAEVNAKLLTHGFIGGLDLTPHGRANGWLLCATEKRTPAEIDAFAAALGKVLA